MSLLLTRVRTGRLRMWRSNDSDVQLSTINAMSAQKAISHLSSVLTSISSSRSHFRVTIPGAVLTLPSLSFRALPGLTLPSLSFRALPGVSQGSHPRRFTVNRISMDAHRQKASVIDTPLGTYTAMDDSLEPTQSVAYKRRCIDSATPAEASGSAIPGPSSALISSNKLTIKVPALSSLRGALQ